MGRLRTLLLAWLWVASLTTAAHAAEPEPAEREETPATEPETTADESPPDPDELEPVPADALPEAEDAPPAPEPSSRSFWQARGLAFLRFGPLQGGLVPGIAYKWEYQRDPKSLLFKASYLQGGLDLVLTPANISIRPSIEILPVAFLKLTVAYFGILYTSLSMGKGHGNSFENVNSPFDADSLDTDDMREEASLHFVHRVIANLQLRLKFGPVVILNDTEIAGWYVPDGAGRWQGKGTYWYGSFYDTLIRRAEWDGTVMNQTILAFQAWTGDSDEARLLIGVLNEYVYTFGAGFERDRLGAVVVLTPQTRLWTMDRPTIIMAAGVTLIDKNRAMQPWFALALKLHWDLIDRD